MKRLFATTLALALAATTGVASAQSYGSSYYGQQGYGQQGYGQQAYPDRYGQSRGVQYDYARVLRVDPVFDSRYGSSYPTSNGQRCYESQTYADGNGYDNSGYNNNGYNNNGYNNGYGNNGYNQQQGGYYDQNGNYRRTSNSGGTQAGGTIATVIGGVVGAVIGSQVGGGSARYATSAIGSLVGGVAGRQIYEQGHRQRGPGTVRVCDPVPVGGNYNGGYNTVNDRAVSAYDVTYEYGGRNYTTRTNYHPGNRIRVRVDVRPE